MNGIGRSELGEESRLETLEKIAIASDRESLICVAEFVEQGISGALCSVLLVDDSGTGLCQGAAPSLKEECARALQGVPIGKLDSSFPGSTPFQRRRVVAEDLEAHPLWERFPALGEAGVRACWTEPVFAGNGTLLGALAVCFREPRAPREEELRFLESAARLAGIAIGKVRAARGRRFIEEQARHGQKIEAVGQLAAGVAHDFNNLLTPIIVYADMLLRLSPAGSPQAKMVESMSTAAQKASDLTQKLLSFGRKQALNLALWDLNEVIVSFRETVRAATRQEIAIDLCLSPGAVMVHADRAQLEQILLNLLSNARDAIEGAGSISLETGHLILDEEFHRQHPVAKPGHYVLLAVSDDGCGMAEEVLRHMYEPFFSTKERGRGTGLGLSTVYGVVKRHGGCIDVKSSPGEGTRFAIYLPAASGSAETILPPSPQGATPDRSGGGRSILLVQDDNMTREVAQQLLVSFQYRVLAARTPGEALELAAEQQGNIDLLATDMIMPEMTGPELYRKLLQNHPGLPVLYISGYTGNNGSRQDGQGQEAFFLAKPFTLEQFLARVGETIAAGDGEVPSKNRRSIQEREKR